VYSQAIKIERHACAGLAPAGKLGYHSTLPAGTKPAASGKRQFVVHPLLTEDGAKIRTKIRTFLHDHGYLVRNSNIIFVCGGNDDNSMRSRFMIEARPHLLNFRLFKPEDAVSHDFLDRPARRIDLSSFENLIAKLAICTVIFPEAPGSFAELGLFSEWSEVRERLLPVLDSNRQEQDSFLLLGPVAQIQEGSEYGTYYLDYTNPDYPGLCTRINNRANTNSRKRKIDIGDWDETPDIVRFAIVHFLLDICRISSIDTIAYLMRGIFDGHCSKAWLADVCAILVGAGEAKLFGEEHSIIQPPNAETFIDTISKHEGELIDLRFAINEFYQDFPEFMEQIREAHHAD
jgi:hypothetical protein